MTEHDPIHETNGDRTDEQATDAPADVAPELADAADDVDATNDDRRLMTDGGRDDPFPGVPDVETGDDGDGGEMTVPPTDREPRPREQGASRSSSEPHSAGAPASAGAQSDDDCCTDGGCTCGSDGDGGSAGSASAHRAVPDGGGVANVDENGSLGDIEFTEPAADVSQNVDDGEPDVRVGVPEGVDLETPTYSIRSEMNDMETPDDKTWFMELDEAVIDEGRCIQCGTCVAACPSDSIGIGDDDLPELVKMCTGCSLCWDFCPRGGLRYERQWKITGGDDNVSGAGDPITEFSARVDDDWTKSAQDGGVVTEVLAQLLESREIDGAVIATESDDEAWKAESYVATTREELIENAGSFYNQTMALGNLDLERWEHKFDKPLTDVSLAAVGTPCEIEGIRALQDFRWEYGSHEEGVRAIDYTIALMCTKNFNYHRLIGEKLREERGIDPEDIGKLDVLHGKFMAYDHDDELLLKEDVKNFHDAALKGCDECADFTGYCADLTVGSVGSSEEFSSVIVRTDRGMDAWEITEEALEYHDLEDRSEIGKLQSWDKKKAFSSLQRPFDPDAPRFIEYTDHAENYGTTLNPHETGH